MTDPVMIANEPRPLAWGGGPPANGGRGVVGDATSQLSTALGMLRARWRLIAAFTLAGIAVMALVTLWSDREYTATAVVHVENEAPHVTKIDQVITPPSYLESVEYFQDQVNLLQSRTLMAAVIRELHLQDQDRFWARPPGIVGRTVNFFTDAIGRLGAAPPAAPASGGEQRTAPDVATGAINRYGSLLEVKPIPNSRAIQVRVRARDPELAQTIANAHANEYIQRTLRSKFELTGAARRYIEQEITRVRQEVDASEAALNAFRRENNVIAPDDAKDNAVVDRLSDLSRRLTRSQAMRIELEAQHELIQGRDFESVPAVIQSPLVQSLKGQLAQLESREAELGRIFLSGNPELQQVQSQIHQLRARLQQEMQRVVAGVESQYLAAKNTEDALRQELQHQQDTVLNLKEISGQYVKLDQAVQANRGLYAALLQRAGETDVVRGVQLSNISVLDPAERPSQPSRPRTILNLVFGCLLGLVFGVATASVLENVDTSLKTPDDVHRVLELPTLGVIPDFRRVRTDLPDRTGARTTDVPAVSGRSIAAEVFRTLRTSILFFDPEHPPRVMLVTSSQAGEGKTATVVNLAISLAQLGARVLLIDADLRRPRCHHAFGLPPGPGLTEYLQSEAELEQVITMIPSGGGNGSGRGSALAFIQSGRPIHHSAELLGGQRLRAALAATVGAYDVVLVDSPPVFPVADASVLATLVDGVVLVVRGQRTPRHVTQEAIARLRFMQAKILGVVLNGVNPGAGEYQHRYSYYFRDAAGA